MALAASHQAGDGGHELLGPLDIREVVHQIDANRNGLTILAGAVGALHLTIAALSADNLRRHPL